MSTLIRIVGRILVSRGMGLDSVDNFSCSESFPLALVYTACYVFTKLLRPLVKFWRSKGRRVIVYIEYGICAASTLEEAEKHSTAIQADLGEAGFVLNLSKSKLHPGIGLGLP